MLRRRCHGDAMTALNRKLWRDLGLIRTQALAIALVVAAGVAMYVMYMANFESLRRTQQAFYAAQHFADVFASLKRAPARVAGAIADIPGVAALETRVVATVPLHLPDSIAPASARLVSIPADRRPRVNDLFLRSGRWLDAHRPDEVLANEGFVAAHGLKPGDTIRVVINGRLRQLTLVGVALSPEYVYSLRPGELVPDDRRYAILWMNEAALAAAFEMEGGFNDVALALAPGAQVAEVLRRVDRMLAPYGGFGAIAREHQMSHWTVENELVQLQSFGFLLPFVFLLVAAFTLHMTLTRMLALQRPQIAALKAIGYGNAALAWHFMKLALAIGAIGVATGVGAGAWMGSGIGDLYNRYFRFPHLLFSVPVRVIVGAAAFTVITAAVGALAAVRRAVSIPPAEAMRPEPPARFGRSALEAAVVLRHMHTASRIVLRRLSHRPYRTAASVLGLALGVATLMACLIFVDSMHQLIATQFWRAERQDVFVMFTEPESADALRELAALPGMRAVEPQRMLAVRIRSAHRVRQVVLAGLPADAQLRRVVTAAGRPVRARPGGLLISAKLADVLEVRPGATVSVEILEGTRRVLTLPIAATVDDVMGLWAYLDAAELHARLGEAVVVSGAVAQTDATQQPRLAAALARLPQVASVSFKRDVLRTFRDAMSANLNLTLSINVLFAAIIAFGVVYNAARVALSEQSYDLASLRVLGFTREEISLLLLGELAVLTVLALPLGALLGYGLALGIVQTLQSEVYRFPLYVTRSAVGWAWLGVAAASVVSALIVRRRLDTLDLIAVLKVRE